MRLTTPRTAHHSQVYTTNSLTTYFAQASPAFGTATSSDDVCTNANIELCRLYTVNGYGSAANNPANLQGAVVPILQNRESEDQFFMKVSNCNEFHVEDGEAKPLKTYVSKGKSTIAFALIMITIIIMQDRCRSHFLGRSAGQMSHFFLIDINIVVYYDVPFHPLNCPAFPFAMHTLRNSTTACDRCWRQSRSR